MFKVLHHYKKRGYFLTSHCTETFDIHAADVDEHCGGRGTVVRVLLRFGNLILKFWVSVLYANACTLFFENLMEWVYDNQFNFVINVMSCQRSKIWNARNDYSKIWLFIIVWTRDAPNLQHLRISVINTWPVTPLFFYCLELIHFGKFLGLIQSRVMTSHVKPEEDLTHKSLILRKSILKCFILL